MEGIFYPARRHDSIKKEKMNTDPQLKGQSCKLFKKRPTRHERRLFLMLHLTLGGEFVEVILEGGEFFQNSSQRRPV